MLAQTALLLGIPVTRDEFFSASPDSDYLRKYSNRSLDWSETYAPYIAAPLGELADNAARMGVRVYTGAVLETLSQASSRFDTIILVTHWKGPEWSKDDLIDPADPGALADRAARGDTVLARWLSRCFLRYGIVQPFGNHKPTTGFTGMLARLFRTDRSLHDIMRKAVDVRLRGDRVTIRGVSRTVETPITRKTRRREELDRLFEGLIRPGNRLELFDGLHDKVTLNAAIHPDFNGILDLTTCTSTPLAEYLMLKRELRPNIVQLDKEQHPEWSAQLLQAALELTSEETPYLQARSIAISCLRQEAAAEAAQRRHQNQKHRDESQ